MSDTLDTPAATPDPAPPRDRSVQTALPVVAGLVAAGLAAVLGSASLHYAIYPPLTDRIGARAYTNWFDQLWVDAGYVADYGPGAWYEGPAQWTGLAVALVLIAVLTAGVLRLFLPAVTATGSRLVLFLGTWAAVFLACSVAGLVRAWIAFDPLYATDRFTGMLDDGLSVGPPSGFLTGWLVGVVVVLLHRRRA